MKKNLRNSVRLFKSLYSQALSIQEIEETLQDFISQVSENRISLSLVQAQMEALKDLLDEAVVSA